MTVDRLTQAVRDVADFPKPGILFKDITPILLDAELFKLAVELFIDRHRGGEINKVAAIEARGFIFGAVVARSLDLGLVTIRKQGKLPSDIVSVSYSLEYGESCLEIHRDAIAPGDQVLLIDDLLATGGTAAASAALIEQLGGRVAEMDFLIELSFLNGRDRLQGHGVFAPIKF